MSLTEKLLLVGSYEAVMPYETLTYRAPMPKFYQVEYKSSINIDLINDVEIKEVYNTNIKFFQMFQDRLSDRTIIFMNGSKIDNSESSVGMASWSLNEFFIFSHKLLDRLLPYIQPRLLPY